MILGRGTICPLQYLPTVVCDTSISFEKETQVIPLRERYGVSFMKNIVRSSHIICQGEVRTSATTNLCDTNTKCLMNTIRNRLKSVRTGRKPKITQQKLADMIGVERTAITKIETGEHKLTDDAAHKIAAALDCHPGELFAPLPEQDAVDIARSLRAMDGGALADWIEIGRRLAGKK